MSAAAESSTTVLVPGYRLDRYELLCPIAEGGMASVWVARQRGKHGFEKLVAIKTILPKFAADIRFQEMFLDEARIASRIEHVNVARILDLGEEEEILYLAMEYVDGDSLSKLNRACQKKGLKIPVGVAMRVLVDTCAGLHEAHELRDNGRPLEIVHRDVSPHNILVSTRGVAKLIDFGIAKARSRVGSDTNSGVLKGKVQYMAPEQALAQPVDRRADLWAIGATLYHVIAGRPPYDAENQLATLHLLGSGRPPTPLPAGVHPAIAAIVRKALAHAPDRRFSTAKELGEALEDVMIQAGAATTASDVEAFTAEHMAERAERRRRAIDAALAAAAERHPVEDLLPPVSERNSVGSVTPVRTVADAPVGKSGADAVAKLAVRVSEVPPTSRSYATLGSAALDASALSVPRPTSLRTGFVATAVVGIAVATAAALSIAMWRSRAPNTTATATPPAATATVTTGATQDAMASQDDLAAVVVSSERPIVVPSVAATAQHKVAPRVPGSAPPPSRATPSAVTPIAAPVVPVAASAATISSAAPSATVDDGF